MNNRIQGGRSSCGQTACASCFECEPNDALVELDRLGRFAGRLHLPLPATSINNKAGAERDSGQAPAGRAGNS